MSFRSNVVPVLTALLISAAMLYGCFSFRFFKGTEGREIVPPGDTLKVGSTTLHEALSLLGAPDQVVELKGKDLLVYERAVLRQNRVSVGIPVTDVWGVSADISAYGNLARYDTLALFFTPDGVLRDMAYEKGSIHPYLKTLFQE